MSAHFGLTLTFPRRGLPQLGTLGAGNHYAEIQASIHGTAVEVEL